MKTLFLHIPKTAGSSLLSSELGSKIDTRIHSFVGSLEDKIRELNAMESFKFCFIRNPWDRFSSLYHYFFYMPEDHMFYKYNPSIIKLVRRYKTFEDFCLAFPKLNIKNFHFYSQCKYMYIGEQNIIDYVGKMETLNDDVERICARLEVDLTKEIPHSNKSHSNDYRDLYSLKMKNIVKECYPEDVNLLGYKF
jgi:chondroitin 4-sulfotransferase 11